MVLSSFGVTCFLRPRVNDRIFGYKCQRAGPVWLVKYSTLLYTRDVYTKCLCIDTQLNLG